MTSPAFPADLQQAIDQSKKSVANFTDDPALANQLSEYMQNQLNDGSVFSEFIAPGGEDGAMLYGGKMKVTKTDAENVTIYSNLNGEPRSIRKIMFAKTMRQKLPDGRPAFSFPNPLVEYRQGTIKCMLHPEHPNRDLMRQIGMDGADFDCRKTNLPSMFMANQHFERKHPISYRTWNEWKVEEDRRQTLDFQRMQMEAMKSLAGERAGTADDRVYCGVDGCARFFDSETSAAMHRAKHKE